MKRSWARIVVLTLALVGLGLLFGRSSSVGAQTQGFPTNVTFEYTSNTDLKGDIWVQQGGQKFSGVMLMNFERPDLDYPYWGFPITGTALAAANGRFLVRYTASPGNEIAGHYPNNPTDDPSMTMSSLTGSFVFVNTTVAAGTLSYNFSNVPANALAEWPSSQVATLTVGNIDPQPNLNALGVNLGSVPMSLHLTAEGWRWSIPAGHRLETLGLTEGFASVHTFPNLPPVSIVKLEDDQGLEFAQFSADRAHNTWQIMVPAHGLPVYDTDGNFVDSYTEGTLFNP